MGDEQKRKGEKHPSPKCKQKPTPLIAHPSQRGVVCRGRPVGSVRSLFVTFRRNRASVVSVPVQSNPALPLSRCQNPAQSSPIPDGVRCLRYGVYWTELSHSMACLPRSTAHRPPHSAQRGCEVARTSRDASSPGQRFHWSWFGDVAVVKWGRQR